MELIIRKTIGKNNYNFVVQGRNLHELVMESQKLSFNDIYKCGCCESENLVLSAHVAKEGGYKYTEIRCLSCKATLTFGQKKEDPDTFYLRKTEDKKFDWKEFKKQS